MPKYILVISNFLETGRSSFSELQRWSSIFNSITCLLHRATVEGKGGGTEKGSFQLSSNCYWSPSSSCCTAAGLQWWVSGTFLSGCLFGWLSVWLAVHPSTCCQHLLPSTATQVLDGVYSQVLLTAKAVSLWMISNSSDVRTQPLKYMRGKTLFRKKLNQTFFWKNWVIGWKLSHVLILGG